MQVSSHTSGLETVQSFRERVATYLLLRETDQALPEKATAKDAASKYIPGSDSSNFALDGIYSDPKLGNTTTSASSDYATRVKSVLDDISANDVVALREEARERLEAELGREFMATDVYNPLNEGESLNLSFETKKLKHDAFMTHFAVSFASITPDENARELVFKPDAGLDVSTENGHADAVQRELNNIVNFNMTGLRNLHTIAQDDTHHGSDIAQKALSDAGITGADDLEELKKSLYALHKERFESGELELTYRGHALTPPAR